MLPYENWYESDRQFLINTFGDDYQLVAGLLSACSPQVHVKISWSWAMQIYHEYKAGKRPNLSGLMKCHRANVKRVLSGQELSGNKVRAFYQNLTGDEQAVTLDTWMLRLFKWFDHHKRVPTNRQYEKLCFRFRQIADSIGISPSRLQAALWTKYRIQNGFKPVSYSIVGQNEKQYTFADLY